VVEYDIDSLSLGVLLAVYNGIKDPREIASRLNVDEESINEVIEELIEKGLLKKEEKKILFFKREDLKLTREGYNTLMTALERIRPKLEKAIEMVRRGEGDLDDVLRLMGLGFLLPLLPLMWGLFFTALPFGEDWGGEDSHIYPGEPF